MQMENRRRLKRMAIIRRCDKCGALDVKAMVTVRRRRKFRNQHDGDYTTEANFEFDVCDNCAREIELLFVSEEEADQVIIN